MNLHIGIAQGRLLRSLLVSTAVTLSLLPAGVLLAQSSDSKTADAKSEDAKPVHPKPDTYETFYLANSPQQNDLNDMQTLLRNMLPWARIYGIPSQHAIVVYATKEDIATARTLLAATDKKKVVYRLIYTLSAANGSKHLYSMVATSGERASMKLGDRVPIVVSKSGSEASAGNVEVQYIDLGLSVEANLDTAADSVRLRTKLEQSSLADEKFVPGVSDPTIHQTTLESNAILVPGKALLLGSLDVPGSTHPVEVEVVAEPVK